MDPVGLACATEIPVHDVDAMSSDGEVVDLDASGSVPAPAGGRLEALTRAVAEDEHATQREKELVELIRSLHSSKPSTRLRQHVQATSALEAQRDGLVFQMLQREQEFDAERLGWEREAEALIRLGKLQEEESEHTTQPDAKVKAQAAEIRLLQAKLTNAQEQLQFLESELSQLPPLLLMQPIVPPPSSELEEEVPVVDISSPKPTPKDPAPSAAAGNNARSSRSAPALTQPIAGPSTRPATQRPPIPAQASGSTEPRQSTQPSSSAISKQPQTEPSSEPIPYPLPGLAPYFNFPRSPPGRTIFPAPEGRRLRKEVLRKEGSGSSSTLDARDTEETAGALAAQRSRTPGPRLTASDPGIGPSTLSRPNRPAATSTSLSKPSSARTQPKASKGTSSWISTRYKPPYSSATSDARIEHLLLAARVIGKKRAGIVAGMTAEIEDIKKYQLSQRKPEAKPTNTNGQPLPVPGAMAMGPIGGGRMGLMPVGFSMGMGMPMQMGMPMMGVAHMNQYFAQAQGGVAATVSTPGDAAATGAKAGSSSGARNVTSSSSAPQLSHPPNNKQGSQPSTSKSQSLPAMQYPPLPMGFHYVYPHPFQMAQPPQPPPPPKSKPLKFMPPHPAPPPPPPLPTPPPPEEQSSMTAATSNGSAQFRHVTFSKYPLSKSERRNRPGGDVKAYGGYSSPEVAQALGVIDSSTSTPSEVEDTTTNVASSSKASFSVVPMGMQFVSMNEGAETGKSRPRARGSRKRVRGSTRVASDTTGSAAALVGDMGDIARDQEALTEENPRVGMSGRGRVTGRVRVLGANSAPDLGNGQSVIDLSLDSSSFTGESTGPSMTSFRLNPRAAPQTRRTRTPSTRSAATASRAARAARFDSLLSAARRLEGEYESEEDVESEEEVRDDEGLMRKEEEEEEEEDVEDGPEEEEEGSGDEEGENEIDQLLSDSPTDEPTKSAASTRSAPKRKMAPIAHTKPPSRGKRRRLSPREDEVTSSAETVVAPGSSSTGYATYTGKFRLDSATSSSQGAKGKAKAKAHMRNAKPTQQSASPLDHDFKEGLDELRDDDGVEESLKHSRSVSVDASAVDSTSGSSSSARVRSALDILADQAHVHGRGSRGSTPPTTSLYEEERNPECGVNDAGDSSSTMRLPAHRLSPGTVGRLVPISSTTSSEKEPDAQDQDGDFDEEDEDGEGDVDMEVDVSVAVNMGGTHVAPSQAEVNPVSRGRAVQEEPTLVLDGDPVDVGS